MSQTHIQILQPSLQFCGMVLEKPLQRNAIAANPKISSVLPVAEQVKFNSNINSFDYP